MWQVGPIGLTVRKVLKSDDNESGSKEETIIIILIKVKTLTYPYCFYWIDNFRGSV